MKWLLLSAVLLAIGCGGPGGKNSTLDTEVRQTESNHSRLVGATPPPQFDVSLERKNLVRKLQELNVEDKVMYIHCMAWDGKVIMVSPVQGKVSSLNSMLTTPQQVKQVTRHQSISAVTLPSPDFDGSYGPNPNGVFWFAPSGEYCEWNGLYFLSSFPRKINTPISLTASVGADGKPME